LNFTIDTYGSLPSTQDAVKDRAAKGAAEGLVVQALTQTGGRGRHGNVWDSPMGNLYMSVLLRPACSAALAWQISFVAAVALSKAMDKFVSRKHIKTLKWPNDVLIDNKKCAGILLESELGKDGTVEWLALGIGVNILSPPPDRIGLKDTMGSQKRLAIHPFRDVVLEEFQNHYDAWRVKGFAPIRKTWLKQAHGLNEPIKVRLTDKTLDGVFEGIDDSGALLLRQKNGDTPMVIHAGEVFF
jgi:BirA family biotin operon repressor/biotin-[acetyl-CoA-carboxylase] ligase